MGARLLMSKANYIANSVDTIITLSSPHAYPPVPLDAGVENVYRIINTGWAEHANKTLLISLSGGVLDNQLSSEPASLGLARLWHENTSLSAFTSGLPALWSGVDHLAMMWCDQLRERIARGFLAIEGRAMEVVERRERWRRMLGMERDSEEAVPLSGQSHQISSKAATEGENVTVYAVSDAGRDHDAFELITNRAVGLDVSFGPPIEQEAQIRTSLCSVRFEEESFCQYISPSAYDLLPPSPSTAQTSPSDFPSFPNAEERYEVPGKGLWRLRISLTALNGEKVDHIRVEKRQVLALDMTLAAWTERAQVFPGNVHAISPMVVPLEGHTTLESPSRETIVTGMDNSLLAYDLSVLASVDTGTLCRSASAPMLRLQSLSTGDTQYYPSLTLGTQHTLTLHGTSPYMPPAVGARRATRFTLLLDQCARVKGVSVQVNWPASAGLLLSRYRTALGSFPIAALVLLASTMWDEWDQGGSLSSAVKAIHADSVHLLQHPFLPSRGLQFTAHQALFR